ncbi:hypothetical protein THAOC_37884, partial [Thalassiosira oceanica]
TSPMARTRNAFKRQKVATVESALFNPDVVFLLAALLEARDLCQVSLTCKTLGGKRANAVDGLSLVEEAARRLFECASAWERSCLPKYPGEGWIELTARRNRSSGLSLANVCRSSALCSNHVMRVGKHFAVFTGRGSISVIRPVQIKTSDFGEGELNDFSPTIRNFWEYQLRQRTARWTDSNVHCCDVSIHGDSFWDDWASNHPSMTIDGFQRNTPIGLLLDLDEGTLSLYQNGQKVATLKDGLSGEYCWYATVWGAASVSIKRGLAPGEQQG